MFFPFIYKPLLNINLNSSVKVQFSHILLSLLHTHNLKAHCCCILASTTKELTTILSATEAGSSNIPITISLLGMALGTLLGTTVIAAATLAFLRCCPTIAPFWCPCCFSESRAETLTTEIFERIRPLIRLRPQYIPVCRPKCVPVCRPMYFPPPTSCSCHPRPCTCRMQQPTTVSQ